ncbi:glycosyltransferase family 1 protein [Polaromonas sp.]|uniref:glycosyltransferase family 4 protein n=1 Tax=Polaromonas sp. TaxID=1869339 RepID=UPI00326535DB
MAPVEESRVLKVAFDQQVFLLQEYGGISRYLCNLAKFFVQMEGVEARIIAPLHFNKNLDAMHGLAGGGLLLPKVNTKLLRVAMAMSKRLARFGINQYRPDILHETYYSSDDYRPRGAKRVLTVYDLIHERYGNMFENSEGTTGPKKAAALRADHVICISESTRRDLIDFCGVAKEKTSVIYLGTDVAFLGHEPLQEEIPTLARPFLLYVGNRDGYKNFSGFLKAFANSSRLKAEFDIVCFGGGPFQVEEKKMAASLGLDDDRLVHRAGSDQILANLYRGAAAFVYPSLYEGFGIPPLEAMAMGCPVISSDTSSLPEVVGDAGEYFDPMRVESMTAAMERVTQSPSRSFELVKLGRQQYRKFSWEKCAQETMMVYRSLL